MTRICIKGTGADDCGCKNWLKGIRTINGQYPDDNREFGINAGNGIRITPATAGITITNDATPSSYIEGDNIEITPSGNDKVIGLVSDPIINGDLQVNGDIIQNGSAYETHAEQVYTTKDYIITRDGAISALSAGDYSGFQVKKYDGTNDGRLVIDNQGVARVGDVGDEQPLLTRDESASLNNGDLLQWNSTAQKAVSANVNTSQIVRGTGNIGSDTKPIKVVNGVATAVTDDLAKISDLPSVTTPSFNSAHSSITITQKGIRQYGKIVCITSEIRSDAVIPAGTILLKTDALPVVRSWGAFISLSSNSNNLSLDLRTNGDIASTGNTTSGMYYEINLAYVCL